MNGWQRLLDSVGTKVKVTEFSPAGTVVTYTGVLTSVEEHGAGYVWLSLDNEWTLEFEIKAGDWMVDSVE